MNPEKYRTHQHTFLIDYLKKSMLCLQELQQLFTKELPNEASHK